MTRADSRTPMTCSSTASGAATSQRYGWQSGGWAINERVAVKIVRRRGGERDRSLETEIKVMKEVARLPCPYLLKLFVRS